LTPLASFTNKRNAKTATNIMTTFLAIQNTYEVIELALFDDSNVIDSATIDKKEATKTIVTVLHALLERNKCSLDSLKFFAVNQGPGPFTTLRVVIATMNGLAFATNIPLIGVDGLDALCAEEQDASYPITVVLLNAFNADVYYAIQVGDAYPQRKGCMKIDLFLKNLKIHIPDKNIRFLGNGAELYQQEIMTLFGIQAQLPSPQTQTCSVFMVGIMALVRWQQKNSLSSQLLPLYLKQFQTQTTPAKR
jgi:tRNA threonylcarbamoyl adenosine modification protein YeaZ